MGLFRRRNETLNEQLLRQAGLDPAEALGARAAVPHELTAQRLVRPRLPDGSGVDPREWDTAVTVTAPGLVGDRVEFTTIPDGDVIVSEESGDADLSPLADAVEKHVDPPYRAVAARQDGNLWAVGAKRISVAKIPFPTGDRLELSWTGALGEGGELRVDGVPSDAAVPAELSEVGALAGASFYVEAQRIDDDLWEVRATGY